MSIERRRHFRELSLQVLFFIDSVYPEILGKPKRIAVSSTSDDPNNSVEHSEPRSKLVRKGVRKRISKAASQIDLHTNDATDNNQPLTDDERLIEGNRVLNDFWLNFKESSQEKNNFFLLLTQGVIQNIAAIDQKIEQFSSNWKIERMTCVDRNILRIAVFEIMYCSDIPYKVSINEAIDIGKNFGTNDSGSFVNGVLDSIRLSLGKDICKS